MKTMKMSNQEKLEKIQNERKIMLNTIKESIKNNNKNLHQNISDISFILSIDEKNSKEYKAIIKAQELIVNLTEEKSFFEKGGVTYPFCH